jgi:predicted P-loop ATPase
MPAQEEHLQLPGDDTPVADAAILYARTGFAPIPLHGVTRAGACRCDQGAGCKAPGKHPTIRDWQKQAAPGDLDVARELFEGHDGNIGIVLGTEYVVIDIDLYSDGAKGLEELPAMPETLTARSGSGQGEHRVFVYAAGQDPAEVTNRKVAPGVDVKTRGGQIVVAPSLHASGRRYAWVNPLPPAELPDALYRAIRKNPVGRPARPPATPGQVDELLRRRAERYLAACAPSVSGSGGHAACFAAARACWGWIAKGLPESEAWSLFLGYNERCQPPWNERELAHKWSEAEKADRIPIPEDRPRDGGGGSPPGPPTAGPPSDGSPPAPDSDWQSLLLYRKQKSGPAKLEKHLANVVTILQHHDDWRGRICFDEHAHRILLRDPPWHSSDAPAAAISPIDDTARASPLQGWEELVETDATRLSSWMRRQYPTLMIGATDCFRAIEIVAEAHRRHPFREYLDALTWDGVERLGAWLTDYLDVPPSPYSARVGTWWLTSAVARVYRPGCKADYVLILEGNQGIRKSTALRTLAGAPWFSDTPLDLQKNAEASMAIRGKTIVELGELASFKKADQDRAKVFFSSPVDNVRKPYGRVYVLVPRSCVFAGTVNPEAGYFTDATGNRRYWPVRCGAIDLEALAGMRDQLWAEAVARFRSGGRWWPEGTEEHALCAGEQEPREVADVWEDPVASWCTGRDQVTVPEVLNSAIKLSTDKHDQRANDRVARVLKKLGYERKQVRELGRTNGKRQWVYRLPGTGEA